MSDVIISGSRAQFWIGSTLLAVAGVKIGHKLSTEVTRRLGQQSIAGRTEGIYEPEDITGQAEALVWYRILDSAAMPANGYGNFVFSGMLYAMHPQSTTSINIDLLSCRIVGESEEYKNEAGASMIDLTITVDQIVKNGKTLNRVDGNPGGFGPSAAIGFAANISGSVGLPGGFLPF